MISMYITIAIMHTNNYSVNRCGCSLSTTAAVTCSTSSFYVLLALQLSSDSRGGMRTTLHVATSRWCHSIRQLIS